MNGLPHFIRENRKRLGLTQQGLADRAGVGLRFIRELENGKSTLRMDKVEQVLMLFGHELGPIPATAQSRLLKAAENG
jgi:y4mF family transcriptional regulator